MKAMANLDTNREKIFITQFFTILFIVLWLANPVQSARDITDRDITLAVDRQLLQNKGVSARNIDVVTENGIVTLTGVVDSVLAKDRATMVAESIKGVRSVVNIIEVGPIFRNDAKIKQDINTTLKNAPFTDSARIEVIVKSSVVTLLGTAESFQERQLAETLAKGIKGVSSVENRISVDPDVTRSDDEIEAEIRARLAWDVYVDDVLIEVATDDGVVKLFGKAGSAAEKRKATEDAWVVGVKSVDNDDLVVDWSVRDKMRRKVQPGDVSDEQIRKAILAAMKYHPGIESWKPNIFIDNGVVTLSGVVETLHIKNEIEQIARSTRGVWTVKNHIRVRPGIGAVKRPLPDYDSDTAKKARLLLLKDPYVSQSQITVSLNDGTAILSGNVDSHFEKNRAENIVSRVNGIVFIKNSLEVKERWTPEEDWVIREDIRDELWWSPVIQEEDVAVIVEDGVATLTGVVNNLRERRMATKNAIEGGARSVKNHLKVRYGPQYLRP